jgi:5-methylcytosine-specific restriction enzyme A
MSSLRSCLEPGCSALVRGGSRCPAHLKKGWTNTAPMGSGWATIRKRKLQRDPRCERCGGKAVTVDHLLARAFGGTDSPNNLMSLCARHAAEKNHRDAEEGKRRKRAAG